MKKIIVLLFMSMVTMATMAQKEVGKTTFYPRVGVNLSKISGAEYYVNSDNHACKAKDKVGLVAGMEVEHQLTRDFALSAGMLYSMQGTNYDDSDNTNGDSRSVMKDFRETLHYVNVPVLAVFNGGMNGFAVKAGIQLGYLIDANGGYDIEEYGRTDGRWTQTLSSSESYNARWMRNKLDVAIPVGISYEFSRVNIDLRYNFGLTNICNIDGMKAEHNRSWQLTVGYAL